MKIGHKIYSCFYYYCVLFILFCFASQLISPSLLIFLNDAFPSVSLSAVVLTEMMKPFPEDVALHLILLFFLFFLLFVV